MKKNRGLLLAALLLGLLLLTGCSVRDTLVALGLPTPPVFPSATVTPTKTPTPSLSPSPTRKPTPKPTASPSPSPASLGSTASPSPSDTAQAETQSYKSENTQGTATYITPAPAASAAPAYAATPAPAATTAPAAAPAQAGQTPVLSIKEQTLPSDMKQGSVFSLRGIITVDCGRITQVYGALFRATGEPAQETVYYPESDYFSLYGTVNADLRFGILSPDTYIYQVTAKAVNGSAASETILISHAFTVTSSTPVYTGGGGTGSGSYTAKTASGTDNAALIWNYFINEFHNPYAAAAILGNIRAESSCDPMRVEGDISGSYSSDYTANVDSGAYSRDAFLGSPGGKYGGGYGLCQWTAERKGGLYDLAVSRGSSVGDLNTQCAYIMQELASDYPSLLEYLWTADDAEAAAFEFCTVFEQAAVHGGRTDYAKEYLEKYAS